MVAPDRTRLTGPVGIYYKSGMLKKHRPKILLQIKVFADNKKVFEHLFQKVPRSRARRHCRAPRSAKAPIGVFFFCSFFFCACFAKRKSGWRICFFFCLLTILGFCMVGELTHMRSMCVGVAETGGINTYAKHVCWRRRDRGN